MWKMLEENKNLTYKRTNIRIASNFFSEAKQTKKRVEWNIWSVEQKNNQFRILCPEKLSFKSAREIKTFSDKEKLGEFVASTPALHEILQEVF